ncbi:uncharacterized protein LOC130798787 [Amaranthus tricolor]|uniref:uncharacterized protein LOC130798787 n=1 Tax=Amaranthus tricolor TaxID=29722 RepID=UPI0025903328|nr:uncharacterized protein LOC130798787 [Amaranthus tricolor]
MDLHVVRNRTRKRRKNNEFWDSIACVIGYMSIYYVKYIHKEPCMTSFQTGERWIQEFLNSHEKRCFNMLRMKQSTFCQLCTNLESNETVSRVFKEVLNAMDGLSRDIIKPRDPEFNEVPTQIRNDAKYMPHFKDCIGAIDGTHIDVIIREENQLREEGKKHPPLIWEGSAHDSHIFLNTIENPSLNFPIPLLGKYYLADKRYPNRQGFLTPYHKIRYHASEAFSNVECIFKQDVNRAGIWDQSFRAMERLTEMSIIEYMRVGSQDSSSILALIFTSRTFILFFSIQNRLSLVFFSVQQNRAVDPDFTEATNTTSHGGSTILIGVPLLDASIVFSEICELCDDENLSVGYDFSSRVIRVRVEIMSMKVFELKYKGNCRDI